MNPMGGARALRRRRALSPQRQGRSAAQRQGRRRLSRLAAPAAALCQVGWSDDAVARAWILLLFFSRR